MKLNFNIKKNILIILLIILSIYQTRELWFRNSLNHNFFYMFSSKDNFSKNYVSNFLSPYRIITNLGDNKFYIFYEKLKEKEIKNFIDYILQIAIKEGKYIETTNIKWNDILKEKSFIYEYKCLVNFDCFFNIFKNKKGLYLSKLNKFDSIIISPDSKKSNKLNIYFINKENDCCSKYKLTKRGINDIIISHIQDIYKNIEDENMYYISSKLIGLNFKNNIFIPKWYGNFYNYRLIKETKLYSYFNKNNINSIDSSISLFFDNPSTVWQENKNGTYIYSDQNIVVKYFSNNILEYINYKNTFDNKKRTLVEDYYTAINFIDNDIFVKNNYYLYSYEENNNIRKFYFDYTINNFPIKFQYNENINNKLSHFIEVTIKNGVVINYKKLAYIYEVIYNKGEKLYIDATKVIDNLKVDDIINISLEYSYLYKNKYSNFNKNNMNLNWIIK